MGESSKFLKSWTFETPILKLAVCPLNIHNFKFEWFVCSFVLLLYVPSQQLVLRAHTFACNWQQPFLNDSAEGSRMAVEIISWSISTKVWDRAGIELATPGSAVRFASVARHVTYCAMRPGWGLNGQMSVDRLKINQKSCYDLPNSAFWGWLSV